MAKSLRQKQAEAFKSPETRERERILALPTSPNFPGFEIPEEPLKIIRSNEIWRKAETLLAHLAEGGGYRVERQVEYARLYGQKVIADLICSLPGRSRKVVVEAKFLQKTGTWDKKVTDEKVKFERLLPQGDYVKAYIVLVGTGWESVRKQHWAGGVEDTNVVQILDTDSFLMRRWYQEL